MDGVFPGHGTKGRLLRRIKMYTDPIPHLISVQFHCSALFRRFHTLDISIILQSSLLKGTVNVISSYGSARFTTLPLKPYLINNVEDIFGFFKV